MKIKIINGSNINLIGEREKNIYGKYKIKDALLKIKKKYKNVEFFQSNSEGKIINEIQKSKNLFDFFIINLGGYSYTSISILDALLAVKIPYIEIHISNIYKREKFRKNSIISSNSMCFMSGFGLQSYSMAIEYLFFFKKHL
ncbi:type II 3-dehydroquinate dehydratase [Candidatus Vidania fulgoroideorum]